MSDFEEREFTSFNDFFTRKIKQGKRTVSDDGVISPCDGLVSVYKIDENTNLTIKGREYTCAQLLGDEALANQFSDGTCVIIRLTVADYHRYCYIENGSIIKKKFIPGVLHTVRPLACEERNVYKENCREYMVIDSSKLGQFIQMEVGAMLVGKIVNYDEQGEIKRGTEKGRFEFGGSTIALFFEKDKMSIDDEFWQNTNEGFETKVKYGEKISK